MTHEQRCGENGDPKEVPTGPLFEAFPDPLAAVTTIDGDRRIDRVNDAFRSAFDHDTDDRSLPDAVKQAVNSDPTGLVTVGSGGQKSGDKVTYKMRAIDAPDEGEFLVFSDVTAVAEGRERLRALHETTRELMAADDREAVASITATTVENVLSFDLNSVRFHDTAEELLVPVAVSEAVRDVSESDRPAYSRGETVQWEAFDEGELLVFQDIREIDDDVNRTGDGSMLVAPLSEYGVLTMGTQEYDAISPVDEELARVLAANVVAALRLVERKRQLRERTDRLARQNERLDRFASVLSHDLRNPINVAAGYVELLERRLDDDDREAAVGASKAIDRMETMVEQTLTLAREGQTVDDPEPVRIGVAARSAWSTVSAPDAELVVSEAADDAVVSGDPERLRTAFENCFRNAVEHGSTSPRSETPNGAVEYGPSVTVRVGLHDDRAGFYVADDGPGFPEDSEDLLEFGVSTTGGSGFGLAIVSEIVEAHGWTVSLETAPSGGAMISVYT